MKKSIFKYLLIALFSFGALAGCNLLDSMGPNDPPKEERPGPINGDDKN